MHRRQFIALTSFSVAASYVASMSAVVAGNKPRFRAVAFDAFPIFDPGPSFALAEELFPGKGRQLTDSWRTRQFEYTWLLTVEGRYADFRRVTEDALIFALKATNLDLTTESRDRLMEAYSKLSAWPDVLPALNALKGAGIRLGILSNFTAAMLAANVKSAGLNGYCEQLLSTDQVRAFKPAPSAYHMGVEAFGLPKEQIVFAAFGGWDAAGAKSFGYPTFWVNRLQSPAEELGELPDGVGGMAELVKFVLPAAATPE